MFNALELVSLMPEAAAWGANARGTRIHQPHPIDILTHAGWGCTAHTLNVFTEGPK